MSETTEEIKETKEGVLEQGEFKPKKKRGRPKKLINKQDEPVKLNLNKKEENAISKQETEEPVLSSTSESKEKGEENKVELQEVGSSHPESEESNITPIQEITDEKEIEEKKPIEKELVKKEEIILPENIEKLVDFMKDTGGTIEDYVRLNADYTNVDDQVLLKEYYKNIKPHLNADEIDFLLTDQFSHSEDDEENTIRKKNLAMKEEIAKAKSFLEETKSKYYEEIKLRPGVTQEQQKAMDFFNRYNKEQDAVKQRHHDFKNRTNEYFTNDFKGFDFKVSDKKFRYGINNPDNVAETQSDLNNFVKKFLDEKGNIHDVHGYHKAIYAARNADTLAEHFYEQGKADAVKDISAKSKNITNEVRQTPQGDVFINGLKVKAISGVDSSKLKFKKRKFE